MDFDKAIVYRSIRDIPMAARERFAVEHLSKYFETNRIPNGSGFFFNSPGATAKRVKDLKNEAERLKTKGELSLADRKIDNFVKVELNEKAFVEDVMGDLGDEPYAHLIVTQHMIRIEEVAFGSDRSLNQALKECEENTKAIKRRIRELMADTFFTDNYPGLKEKLQGIVRADEIKVIDNILKRNFHFVDKFLLDEYKARRSAIALEIESHKRYLKNTVGDDAISVAERRSRQLLLNSAEIELDNMNDWRGWIEHSGEDLDKKFMKSVQDGAHIIEKDAMPKANAFFSDVEGDIAEAEEAARGAARNAGQAIINFL